MFTRSRVTTWVGRIPTEIWWFAFFNCFCPYQGYRRLEPIPANTGREAGFATGLTHRDKQLFALTFTPMDNLESLINLLIFELWGKVRTNSEITHASVNQSVSPSLCSRLDWLDCQKIVQTICRLSRRSRLTFVVLSEMSQQVLIFVLWWSLNLYLAPSSGQTCDVKSNVFTCKVLSQLYNVFSAKYQMLTHKTKTMSVVNIPANFSMLPCWHQHWAPLCRSTVSQSC